MKEIIVKDKKYNSLTEANKEAAVYKPVKR